MGYEFHKASVLIVEDNLPMVELIKSVVSMFGFREIITATDGEQGFEMFCRHNTDLVISDWMMTPTNGIEMAHKIRQSDLSPNKFVPIILLTGFSQKRRVVEARDRGITEFIVKPFTVSDLYRRIENIIEAPRKFVESDDFFGPDRRRRKTDNFDGPFRRDDDVTHSEKEVRIYKKIMTDDKNNRKEAFYSDDPLIIDFRDKDKDE